MCFSDIMAGRPKKQGIDYFPLDVGFFSDVKIRKIARACGPQSVSILICLLCNIYRENGYYILWDEDLPFVIADEVGVTEGAVKETITKALQVGFFDADKNSVHGVLTSAGIQKRFLLATYQRKEINILEEYRISCTNNSISCANNPINHVDNAQSKSKVKVKENSTKVESKKVGNVRFLPPSLDEVKKYILEKGFSVDAENFVNFYESKGWFVGKNKMKNWKAAVATWEKREKEQPKKQQKPNIVNHDNRKTYHEF